MWALVSYGLEKLIGGYPVAIGGKIVQWSCVIIFVSLTEACLVDIRRRQLRIMWHCKYRLKLCA